MEKVLNLLIDNWEYVTAFILWLFVRLVPTKKNYDIVEMFLNFLGKNVLPNLRKEDVYKDLSEKKSRGGQNGGNLNALLVVLLLAFYPLCSKAQLNGNFKTVRLVNVDTPADTANVLTIDGTIYYNGVTNQFMGLQNGVWKRLIGAGGGGLATASNGLNVLGTNVKWGGSLTENTSINTGIYDLEFVSTSPLSTFRYEILTGSTNNQFILENGNTTILGSDTFGSARLDMTVENVLLTASNNISLHGINYPSTDGTVGQAITTDGAGNLSFTTIGGGGGITNTAANNEIPKSNGTNIVPSGLFVTTNGNIELGTGLAGSSRTIEATGSSSDIQLQLTSKGLGSNAYTAFNHIFTNNTGSGTLTITTDTNNSIVANDDNSLSIESGSSSSTIGNDLTLLGGNAFTTGNLNGGNVILTGGDPNGSGLRGSVMITQSFKSVSTTTYTLLESDFGRLIEFTNVGAITVTLPNGLSEGFNCSLVRDTGAGIVTVTATTTLKSSGTQITTANDFSSVIHTGSNVWRAVGLN